MGAFCCCPRSGDELEDYSTYSIYRNCNCLRPFLLQCFSWGATSTSWVTSTPLTESYMNVANHCASRPLPSDADQRCTRSQRDGLVSRREKCTAHFQEESLLLKKNTSNSNVELLGSGKTPGGVMRLEDEVSPGILYRQPSFQEEDVCPTCLEEYTKENPKITTQCSHHFHLGCIYEWMERSDNCPVCGKEMEFSESP